MTVFPAATDAATLAVNLEYLRLNAFEFTLSINPHAGCHTPIDEHCGSYGQIPDDGSDWISREQQEEAYRTGHFVEGRVYPNGSVSFYTTYGMDISAVVAEMVECCQKDQARWRATGHEPKVGSPAFDARPVPPAAVLDTPLDSAAESPAST